MGGGPTIQIPRWIQLVGLPVLLVLAFLLASTLGHVIFLFLTASVIAFMLNPLVRDVTRLKVPRALAVTFVYLIFAATVVALLIAIGVIAFDQARNAADRIDDYATNVDPETGKTEAEEDIDEFQAWLDDHGLESIQIREQVNEWIASLSAGEISGYVQDAIEFAQGAAISFVLLMFSLILIVVISIYMLLDMPRLERSIDERFPPHGGPPLTQQIEGALWGYVKGQAILSTVIGTSAGVGMWVLGETGLVAGAQEYALLFGLWTAFIEVIPYIGPWLSAVPPVIYALFVDPIGVVSVALLFLFIYQVEGHIVVPNVMASALRLHPLLVIFGLLAGGELYGIAGVLVALPTMAALRAVWGFFLPRFRLERWDEGPPDIPVEVELEPPQVEPPGRRAAPVRLSRMWDAIADEAAADNALWRDTLLPGHERHLVPVFSPLAPPELALGVETIYEGYLVHYGRSRLFAQSDPDTSLLLGDYLYAHGLVRVAATGNVDAVADLAELISLCAQRRADGRDDDGAAWAATAARLGDGELEEARSALRLGGNAGPLEEAARAAAGDEPVARALAAHARYVG
jgi:predicted PurR-regulated permease PerM